MKRFSDLEPRQQLVIYHKVLSLNAQGLGYKRIIKMIFLEHDLRLSLSTLSYWFNNNVKMLGGENHFEALPNPYLSYVLGVLFGDGSISLDEAKQEYKVRLDAIDKEFVEKFSAYVAVLLSKEQNYAVCKTKRNLYSTQIRSKRLYHFIESAKEDFANARQIVEAHPNDFIKGLADSEGCPAVSAAQILTSL